MLKFLLILFLIFYLVYKLAGFLVRVLVVNAAEQHQKQYQQHAKAQAAQSKKAKGGNVNIDFVPKDPKQGGQIKGGDYVDYEEVK